MIYLGFFLDFLVSEFLPFNTYFVIANLDKNRFLSVVFVGLILDFMYRGMFINLIILLTLYIFLKLFKIPKRFNILKNLMLYVIYFNLTYFMFGYSINYFFSFIVGLILQLFYLLIANELLNS